MWVVITCVVKPLLDCNFLIPVVKSFHSGLDNHLMAGLKLEYPVQSACSRYCRRSKNGREKLVLILYLLWSEVETNIYPDDDKIIFLWQNSKPYFIIYQKSF